MYVCAKNFKIMNVAREIVKLLMFAILWALPLATDYLTGKSSYWLYIVSIIGSFIMFSHYETVKEKEEKHETAERGQAD